MARQRRNLVLVLTADEYDRLQAAAAAEERDPYQHARWLLLRGLERPETGEGDPLPEAAAS